MEQNKAMELIESVFTFDDVGMAMMALRKDIDNASLQEKLANDLVEAALENCDDDSDAAQRALLAAAKERVAQYVTSTKSTNGTGCGR